MSYIQNSIAAVLIDYLEKISINLQSEKSNDELNDELNKVIKLLKDEFLLQAVPYKNIKQDFSKIFGVTKRKKAALVFGAGVSMGKPLYMCNWSGLLKNAVTGHFLSCYEKTFIDANDFSNLYGDFLGKFDLYELAQYIENSIRERHATDYLYNRDEIEERVNADMYEIVKRSIYRDKQRDGKSGQSEDDFVVEIEKSLLFRLCKYITDKKINRVLTYNYDNAFEFTYCQYAKQNSDGVKIKKLTPVFIDDQLSDVAEDTGCVCYHVHGYVPYFDEKYSSEAKVLNALKKSEARRLILSEYSYDDMAHSSYKWRNTLQIDTFLKYNCLFFGFSATDKNFKRIVKLMGWRNEGAVFDEEHEAKHYIFMTIDDYIRNIFGDLAPIVFYDKEDCKSAKERKAASAKRDEAQRKLQNDFAENPNDLLKKLIVQCRLMYYTLRSRRKYLKGLNIYPLWCTTYDAVDCFDYMLSSD